MYVDEEELIHLTYHEARATVPTVSGLICLGGIICQLSFSQIDMGKLAGEWEFA